MKRASIAVVIWLAAAGSVCAQQPRERALALFEESRGHYDAGRFDEAAALLEEAYRLQPEPILLYNMARAYEGAGRLEEAVDAYDRYLAGAGEVRDRGAIERRVQTLREQLARQRELEARASDAAAPAETVAAPEVAPAPPPAGGVDPVPWVITAIGVAGLGVGVVLGVLSQGAHDEAVTEPEHRRAVELQQSAYDLATGANAAFVAGGVIALAGLVWGLVSIASSRDGSDERALRLTPNGVAGVF